jgi:hypothetical protein
LNGLIIHYLANILLFFKNKIYSSYLIDSTIVTTITPLTVFVFPTLNAYNLKPRVQETQKKSRAVAAREIILLLLYQKLISPIYGPERPDEPAQMPEDKLHEQSEFP